MPTEAHAEDAEYDSFFEVALYTVAMDEPSGYVQLVTDLEQVNKTLSDSW